MKLIFLGSGSAFTTGDNNYHSNMLLEDNDGKRLLIDCGSDIRFSLFEIGLTYRDIHDVYISHLHADHVGGLEWLAFSSKFDKTIEKPNLYLCDSLVHNLWHHVLEGGLSSLQTEIATLSTYFNIYPIKENSHFIWHKIDFRLVQSVHIVSGFMILPSYGLMFNANGKKVFITIDAQFFPHQIRDFYNLADIIFQDCETSKKRSFVHAHYDELVTLPEEIKRKMWLYHYNPGDLPDAVKDGFCGFVKKGQVFDL